jgi:hypothetical protein
MVKTKVDGAVSRGGYAGSYSAIRGNGTGEFLGAYAVFCKGIADPATIEAWACTKALSLATDLLCEKVVASYCKGVVQDNHNNSGGVYFNIIREIKLRAFELEACSFIHEGVLIWRRIVSQNMLLV